jgi:predicted metal-dependent hydrolase
MKKFLLRAFLVLLVVGILLTAWIAFNLYRPHKVDIRHSDADEIARLDTAMWRSYYAKERLKMYSELTELLQKQYKLCESIVEIK